MAHKESTSEPRRVTPFALAKLLATTAEPAERAPSGALKGFLHALHRPNEFRTHVCTYVQWYHNQNEQISAAKIKRQTRMIPKLISVIEELDLAIIKMANLTKKDPSAPWGSYLKRQRALDFRIVIAKIDEEQQNAAQKRKAKASKGKGKGAAKKKAKPDPDAADDDEDEEEEDDDDDDEEEED